MLGFHTRVHSQFQARSAKRVGYSEGRIYSVFASFDRLIAAINSHTFVLWAQFLEARLANAEEDRTRALIEG